MKKGTGILLIALFALATTASFAADDNKVVSGAKAVGKGIMWGPKKIAAGMKKGFGAMGNGAKKLIGKGS